MSAPKNTIFNYFKKVSSPATPTPSAASPATPKANNDVKPNPPTPSTPLSSRGLNANSKAANTPRSAKKTEPKDKTTPAAKKAKQTPSADGDSKKRKRITLMSDSSDEEKDDPLDDLEDSGDDKDYKADSSDEDESDEEMSAVESDESAESDMTDDDDDDLPKGRKRSRQIPSKSKRPAAKKSKKSSPSSEKENVSTPSTLSNRLSSFASPALKKPKLDLDAIKEESRDDLNGTEGEARDVGSFSFLSFSFLDPKNIRDKNRRRPDEEGYDPTTLYVPESFLKDLTPAQRQWWELKSEHFDTVLFFKMGKFYELFHMDALLGVEKCGLLVMKKEIAHAGFPETAYSRYAEILVDLGYKVARIEQTETPVQMADRCAKMARPTKFDKVVKREICQIASQGTRLQSSCYESRFLTSVCATKIDGKINFGVAFVDTSIGTFHLSSFTDDVNLSRLETLLSVYPPVEIIFERSKTQIPGLTQIMTKLCGSNVRHCVFPSARKTLKMLSENDYFDAKGKSPIEAWPQDLVMHLDEGMLVYRVKCQP